MERKEFYRQYLPHFQQPGQTYFITWCLKEAIPALALDSYTRKIELLLNQIKMKKDLKSEDGVIENLEKEYHLERRKYIKAFNDLLDMEQKSSINLSRPQNAQVVISSLRYWEGKKLTNYAFTIMSNHIHWVFATHNKDEKGNLVYLQDILKSVKQFTSNQINKLEDRKGTLWQKESFDTTIRNQVHLFNAINYTLNNPVKAGLVSDWRLWPASYYAGVFL
jgi:REP element-mobilizing transposase RayT